MSKASSAPANTPSDSCYVIRQGIVRGEHKSSDGVSSPEWELAAGEMFPLGALLARRGVTSTYRASGDVFCLAFPGTVFHRLLEISPVFQDFCTRRLAHLLDLSRARMQAEYAASVTEQRGLATPLSALTRNTPVTVAPQTPIVDALKTMEDRRIGSVPVVDDQAQPLGIFTRQDVIGRIVLPAVPLSAPIADVMSKPVLTLSANATAGDAALMMARHGVRHVVVTGEGGRVSGVVSERDLFGLQRLSVRELASAIRRAPDLGSLVQAAADVRSLSHALVAQGVASGQLTRMIASLNDQLTVRVLDLVKPAHDLAGLAVCWLGLGSEGRSEQTIATDQDNGLVLRDGYTAPADLPVLCGRFSAALAEFGYPECPGRIMVSNPQWCMSAAAFGETVRRWLIMPSADTLMALAIFMDAHAVAGDPALLAQVRGELFRLACDNDAMLARFAAAITAFDSGTGWWQRLLSRDDGASALDLKKAGTFPLVHGVRSLALAHRITATGTAERVQALVAAGALTSALATDLIDSLHFFMGLKLKLGLQAQVAGQRAEGGVSTEGLSSLDRDLLKDTLAVVKRFKQLLRQRFHLDAL